MRNVTTFRALQASIPARACPSYGSESFTCKGCAAAFAALQRRTPATPEPRAGPIGTGRGAAARGLHGGALCIAARMRRAAPRPVLISDQCVAQA